MANFDTAYKILIQLEYAKNPSSFLHLNKGESGYTVAGVYQKWNKNAIDWDFIERVVNMCSGDIKKASKLLYTDKKLHVQIIRLFRKQYWMKNRLSEINSQVIANEIFISATNIGSSDAVKMAQRLIHLKDDGLLGKNSLRGLNATNELFFSEEFDKKEKANYQEIISKNPSLAINLKGWINRSDAV